MLRLKLEQRQKYSMVEYAIMLCCIVGLCFASGCVQRTYTNESQELGNLKIYDVRVTSNSFLADSAGQNLNGVFGDGAYFGADTLKSEINTMAIEAVAEAMKSPLFEILKLNLK